MSTMAEIESAVNSLPRHEQEMLYAHLGVRLGTGHDREGKRREALAILRSRLALDVDKVHAWQALVREARH